MTREVAARLLKEGTAWMTPSTWHGQAVLRISVSNWRTTDEDVDRTVAAVRRMLAGSSRMTSSAGWLLVRRPRVEPRADCSADQAATEAESTAPPRQSCRRSATRCWRSPQSRPRSEGYASELGDQQDGGGHQGCREDGPGLGECLLQGVYGMGVVFDGVTQGPGVEVCQPVNERGSENGENDPCLSQMPGRRGDDCGGHHGACDHTLAVDHPKWVAVRCHLGRCAAAFIRGHLAAVNLSPKHGVKRVPW